MSIRQQHKDNLKTNYGLLASVIIALVSGAYFLGKDFGYNKFDKEKIELTKDDIVYQNQLKVFIQKAREDSLLIQSINSTNGQRDKLSGISFNTDSNDLRTVLVNNQTTNPCNSGPANGCWKSEIFAKTEDIVSATVYYHNSGTNIAHDVSIGMGPKDTEKSLTHLIGGGIAIDNYPVKLGSATIHLANPGVLRFIRHSIHWLHNQNDNNFQIKDTNALFSREGFPIGNITPEWKSQGAITISYQVVE